PTIIILNLVVGICAGLLTAYLSREESKITLKTELSFWAACISTLVILLFVFYDMENAVWHASALGGAINILLNRAIYRLMIFCKNLFDKKTLIHNVLDAEF